MSEIFLLNSNKKISIKKILKLTGEFDSFKFQDIPDYDVDFDKKVEDYNKDLEIKDEKEDYKILSRINVGNNHPYFLSQEIIDAIFFDKKNYSDERKNEIIKMFNKELLNDFVESKKSVMERLKTANNKEEGNKIYTEYVATNKLMLEKINNEHSVLLENVFMKDTKYNFTPEEWNIANNFLKDYDLELLDMGEGNAIIAQVPNFYYDIFKDYVTNDYRDYLELVTKEYNEPYFGIEEILVPHEKIADRILAWEEFQKNYPNSDFIAMADIEANVYRRAYILGAYNLHTREGGSEKPELYYIPDNILKEFNRFIQANPDSPTVEYINFYLENHKNPNIDEILYDKFEKEIVKYYEIKNSNEVVIKDTLEIITDEDKESKGE